VVDTVGSGDAFTAALVCGRLRGWPLARCAHRANAVGALVATRAGAMPNLRDEMAAVMTAG
jgi:fructokinase